MQRSGRSLWRKPIHSPAKNNFQSKVAGKKQYDKKVCFSSLQPGDRVLVRNLSERGGPGKLRSYREQQIHVVVGQRGNLPVYEVRPERQTGKPRVLHRNLLLPCTFLPIEPPRTSPPFDSRNSEYQSFQDSCWQASDLKIRRKWIRRRGWTLWFVASRVRDTSRTYRRPWPYCGRPARAGYKWSYHGRRRDTSSWWSHRRTCATWLWSWRRPRYWAGDGTKPLPPYACPTPTKCAVLWSAGKS